MPWIKAGNDVREVDAILFDKDGTLMDFVHTWGTWSEHLLASCAASFGWGHDKVGEAEKLIGILRGKDGLIADYDRNGPLAMGTVEDMLAILALEGYRIGGRSWAEAKAAALLAKRVADGALETEKAAKLLPGVPQFLESCREAGLKLAVVTADETEAAERHLEWLGIRSYFDACIGTDLVENGKPLPDMALLACRQLGVTPSRAAVIGDTNGDMRMAAAAGAAAAIGILDPGRAPSAQLPDAHVKVGSFAELSAGL